MSHIPCKGDTGLEFDTPRGRGKLGTAPAGHGNVNTSVRGHGAVGLTVRGYGYIGLSLPGHSEGIKCNFDTVPELPDYYRLTEAGTPRISEPDVVRVYD